MPEETSPRRASATAGTVGAGKNGHIASGDLPHSNTTARDGQAPNLDAALAAMQVHRDGNSDSHDSHGNRNGSRFHLLPADALDDLPTLRWLIAGEIPESSFAVLYGPTGSGKSFVALDYALRIAQQVPVVYIAAEGAHGYAARKLAWCRHHKLPPGQLYFIAVAPNLLDEHQVDELIATVTEVKPALVIVDTLARTMVGGDENTQRDMGLFVAACDRLRLATDGTVLVVHHTGRNGSHERGSTVLRGASDQVISIENDDGLIRLACEKSKDSSGFPTRGLRLVTVETGRQKDDGTPETSCIVLPSDLVITAGTLTKNGRALLETLALEVFQTAGARAKTLIETTGIKPSTFYSVASQLVKEGLVRQDAKGDPYTITIEGIQRLAVK